MQGMGPTSEVSGMTLGVNKFSSFGVAYENIYKTSHSLVTRPRNGSSPAIIICNTVKGQGVSFMENDWTWHYKLMNKEQYEQALSETPAEGQDNA
jgi:transketolase